MNPQQLRIVDLQSLYAAPMIARVLNRRTRPLMIAALDLQSTQSKVDSEWQCNQCGVESAALRLSSLRRRDSLLHEPMTRQRSSAAYLIRLCSYALSLTKTSHLLLRFCHLESL